MANTRGLPAKAPTANAVPQVKPQPERLMARPVQPTESTADRTISSEPNIQKMPAEVDALHVTTLDDDAFKAALDLGTIKQEVAVQKGDTSDLEVPEPPTQGEEEAAPLMAAQETAPAEQPEAAPEAEVPIPSLNREPETPFTVGDAEGELEIPDLYFNFKANNKEYENIPLDKLVRFAQMGIYNAEKENRYRDIDIHVSQLERRATSAETRVQQLEKYYEHLLSDPDYYDQASMLYQQQNSPEQRVQRAEERARQLQAQFDLEREEILRAARHEAQNYQLQDRNAQERENFQIERFVKQELSPAMRQLMDTHPNVSEAEILGQYTLLTAPLMVGGRIPLNQLHAVKALVDHDLTNWVEGNSAEREFARREADKKVQAAKAAATQAKRQVARAAAPVGSPAPMRPAAPKKYDTVDSWLQDGGGVLPPLQTD